MTDYMNEFSSFAGAKGLSPAEAHYETPAFIRSKRAATTSSRDDSASHDTSEYQNRGRDSQYDPKRFTPTLHASLVSEILNLRRELDSKNSLVENLEQSLANAKDENESINGQLSQQAKELRRGKLQTQQIEKGTYDAVEEVTKERDAATHTAEELRMKLEAATKKTRLQDEDAARTQGIWEGEKESWENERRQLERRVHVTETRLRTFVDEMTAQQATLQAQKTTKEETPHEHTFKDSALGNDSDAASIRSFAPSRHKRNMSSLSSFTKGIRDSGTIQGSPEAVRKTAGFSLADELGSDEDEEEDDNMYDHEADEEDDDDVDEYDLAVDPVSRQRTFSGSATGKTERSSKHLDDLTALPDFPKSNSMLKRESEQSMTAMSKTPTWNYVDSGYQPSPPPSPRSTGTSTDLPQIPLISEPYLEAHERPISSAGASTSPLSPPETPKLMQEGDDASTAKFYSTAATQTDFLVEKETPKVAAGKHDSLEPPAFVPAIAIHPSSRPSSPRPYVLPPGTKNASTQASINPSYRNASMQTGGIRVDMRPPKIPEEYLRPRPIPTWTSPDLSSQPSSSPPTPMSTKRKAIIGSNKIFTDLPAVPSFPSPPVQSPNESVGEISRDNSSKDLRSLRAIPLPRPVLAPPVPPSESASNGHLNRTTQYGVTRPAQSSSQLVDMDNVSDTSDGEDQMPEISRKDTNSSLGFNRAPHGRFGLSEPPKVVPEEKEISPERRPNTAGSFGVAPAPSVSSSRAPSQASRNRPTGSKLNTHSKDIRSRSPSFTSITSSNFSNQSAMIPPHLIPVRSSSWIKTHARSEGSQSPTPNMPRDANGERIRSSKAPESQKSLRKVQSAAAIRYHTNKASPVMPRRRIRSPDLTPVQSVAYDTPEPTKFPIPELPTPLQDLPRFDITKGSVDLGKKSVSTIASDPRGANETDLVEAIAATMVGEWMWKYIRKRKSFGIGEDTSDVKQHQGQNGPVTIPAHGGTRHKRWVWLSPYERTIMWDTKQPTSGAALMGKKGRKLAIESVLDVPDNTPPPRGGGLDTAFRRSILILTPARALKFTVVSKERHALWMTALSFLASSGGIPAQMPITSFETAAPPVPSFEPVQKNKRSESPAFGRAHLRDSVRLTRGRRPTLTHADDSVIPDGLFNNDDEQSGADAPAVPRMPRGPITRHERKRSNTGPKMNPAPTGTRSFSSNNALPSSQSNRLQLTSTNGSNFPMDIRSASSKSGSRQESLVGSDQPNFFEAMGTVRMEAFVDPSFQQGVRYIPAPAGPSSGRRRRGDSNLSSSTIEKRREGYVFDENGLDPFHGF